MYEYQDAPTAGHPGREKTYVLLTRDFYWNHQCKWVRKYVRACEVCQRVKPAVFSQALLKSLSTPSECWQSISMDFVFGLPPDSKRRTGVVVFVDRFSKMVHLAAVPDEVTAVQTARLFVDMVFKHHGMPLDIVSDRDPRFTLLLRLRTESVLTLSGTRSVELPQLLRFALHPFEMRKDAYLFEASIVQVLREEHPAHGWKRRQLRRTRQRILHFHRPVLETSTGPCQDVQRLDTRHRVRCRPGRHLL
ncbi:hypothetical protein PC118_g24746 [Phytophthora cactorum]|nr:hypothetical protein PC112_g24618 [Phytophthora cactorum]KAG2955359.1 hypothetical protein PC118_g24746 [Phytophthora cactorum]